MTTRLAVIGGRGWLGEAIAAAARERGVDVMVLTRTDTPGARAVDLCDAAALAHALADSDVVVNAAGRTGGDPVSMRAANHTLPDRLGALAVAGGWRLVHLGSAAEYGPGAAGHFPVPEGYPTTPTTAYGRTKLAGTESLLTWHERGARALVARVFNVVGEGMPGANPVHGFVAQVVAHARAADRRGHGADRGWPCTAAAVRPVVEVGDPTTVRDLSPLAWMADAVVALALAGRWPSHPIVNVCSGSPTSFGGLAETLGRHVGLDVDVRDLGWPRGGRIVGDARRLRDLVELAPTPSIDAVADAALGCASRRRDHAGGLR